LWKQIENWPRIESLRREGLWVRHLFLINWIRHKKLFESYVTDIAFPRVSELNSFISGKSYWMSGTNRNHMIITPISLKMRTKELNSSFRASYFWSTPYTGTSSVSLRWNRDSRMHTTRACRMQNKI
jgi:hypothetical protein